jgi:hypothetical protein
MPLLGLLLRSAGTRHLFGLGFPIPDGLHGLQLRTLCSTSMHSMMAHSVTLLLEWAVADRLRTDHSNQGH